MFLSFLLLGCGTDSSSGPQDASTIDSGQEGEADDTQDNTDFIDSNPVIDGSEPGTGDDTNTSDGSDNGGGDDVEDIVSIYDPKNAQYDENACDPSTYRTVKDASYNGSEIGENGSGYYVALGHGLQIKSEHQEASPDKSYKTWVTLYFKRFPGTQHLELQGTSSYRASGIFSLIYDNAWADGSIPDIDNTVYVRSDKDYDKDDETQKPDCYRLRLNSVSSIEIDVQKVYR